MRELGILVLTTNQERDYFNQLGVQAKRHNFTLYLHTPNKIDFKSSTVKGKKFVSTDHWMNDIFKIPAFTYDRCFYPTQAIKYRYLPFVQYLKKSKKTVFIGHGLLGKLAVTQTLSHEKTLEKYLPKTEPLNSLEQLIAYLHSYNAAIIKPISGSQGNDLHKVSLVEDGILLNSNRNGITENALLKNEQLLSKWAFFYIQNGRHLIQPYLHLKVENIPFDVRILLQKDGQGKWFEQGRGIRTGRESSLVSNLHSGGTVVDYDDWMNKYFDEKKSEINPALEHIVNKIPEVLEDHSPPLFELGLDIGVDQDGAVWILEVNSKPGHQVLESNKNHNMYEAPFLYCLYLLKKEGMYNGKSLSN